MKARNLRHYIDIAMKDTPVVLVNGARQTGKTTLVKEVAAKRKASYVTLDDHASLDAALNDPAGFIAGLGGFAVIDEVQNAPNIFRAIKASVDRDRRPGRFLLTGSANVLVLPKLGDSLAGRMEIVTLYPMAQDELAGRKSGFIDAAFGKRLPITPLTHCDRSKLARKVFAGGYPEVMGRAESARRNAWYKAYVTGILQRDVRDISNITDLTAMPKLLAQLAMRSSGLMNLADIGRGIDAPHTTLRRYLALLEATFLHVPLRPWTANRSNRLVKAEKIHLSDSGFAAHLCGIRSAGDLGKSDRFGNLLETFVVGELRKMNGWSKTFTEAYHFRNEKAREVDVVLEDTAGRVVGIEVKASSSIGSDDLIGLKQLREIAGKKWVRGIVLHSGPAITGFDKDLHAVPMSAMWEW
ncbi:MAG: ATP-binding protein [Flavobacteriales bacterium]|nr:ATP-binding protein [Flavobacteriales bacterium]